MRLSKSRSASQRATLLIAVASISLLSSACASPWQSNYQSFDPTPFSERDAVTIYTVEPERLFSWWQGEQRHQAESERPIEAQSWDDRHAFLGRLLKASRVQEPPDKMAVLGASSFVKNERRDHRSGELAAHAKRIGADYVGFTHVYLGREAAMGYMPMIGYWDATGTGGYAYGQSTALVPTMQMVDRHWHLAIFYRRLDDDELHLLKDAE